MREFAFGILPSSWPLARVGVGRIHPPLGRFRPRRSSECSIKGWASPVCMSDLDSELAHGVAFGYRARGKYPHFTSRAAPHPEDPKHSSFAYLKVLPSKRLENFRISSFAYLISYKGRDADISASLASQDISYEARDAEMASGGIWAI